MYKLDDLFDVLINPKLALRELNRLYHTRGRRLTGNPNGTDLFNEDWDMCVILDACRYDYLMASSTSFPVQLQKRESVASSTIEWINTCIRGETYLDTVYVSANPKLVRSAANNSCFHDCIFTWDQPESTADELASVDPELVLNLTLQARDDYPNKRILAHFVQPHLPFIGPKGRELFDGNPYEKSSLTTNDMSYREAFRAAYAENTEYVMEYVNRLLAETAEKVVVTADHGQLLGERTYPIPIREYGHPAGIYVPELVEVPWLVRDATQRPQIVSEDPVTSEEPSPDRESEVDNQLKQLGYL